MSFKFTQNLGSRRNTVLEAIFFFVRKILSSIHHAYNIQLCLTESSLCCTPVSDTAAKLISCSTTALHDKNCTHISNLREHQMYVNSAHSIIKTIHIKVKQLQPQGPPFSSCWCTLYTWAVMLHVKTHVWNRDRAVRMWSHFLTCFHGLTLSLSYVLSICGANDYGD